MYRKVLRAFDYLSFLLSSSTWHSVHSPFVFDLISTVFKDHSKDRNLLDIEKVRKSILQNRRFIETTDFGSTGTTGSYSVKVGEVRNFASNSVVSHKDGELLYRLTKHFKPAVIVEFGTCFGLSTSYLAAGNPEARIYTVEGCATKAQIAESYFQEQGLRIRQLTGRFSKIIDQTLTESGSPDLVFVDGDHTYESTISLYDKLASMANPGTILIFHDIYHSSYMKSAWSKICSDERITVSLDLYSMGIVFFRPGITKQHFKLRF